MHGVQRLAHRDRRAGGLVVSDQESVPRPRGERCYAEEHGDCGCDVCIGHALCPCGTALCTSRRKSALLAIGGKRIRFVSRPIPLIAADRTDEGIKGPFRVLYDSEQSTEIVRIQHFARPFLRGWWNLGVALLRHPWRDAELVNSTRSPGFFSLAQLALFEVEVRREFGFKGQSDEAWLARVEYEPAPRWPS
jgi:hypothetical protein